MVLPLLIGFMAAVYHFSWIMSTQLRLRMVEREAPWHNERTYEELTETEIDDDYMLGRPASIDIEYGYAIRATGDVADVRHEAPTHQAMLDLADKVAEASEPAGDLADNALNNPNRSYEHGSAVKLLVHIPSIVGLWDILDMAMDGTYGREGPEWRRATTYRDDVLLLAAREELFDNLDMALDSVPAPGQDLAGELNSYCVESWVDLDGSD